MEAYSSRQPGLGFWPEPGWPYVGQGRDQTVVGFRPGLVLAGIIEKKRTTKGMKWWFFSLSKIYLIVLIFTAEIQAPIPAKMRNWPGPGLKPQSRRRDPGRFLTYSCHFLTSNPRWKDGTLIRHMHYKSSIRWTQTLQTINLCVITSTSFTKLQRLIKTCSNL